MHPVHISFSLAALDLAIPRKDEQDPREDLSFQNLSERKMVKTTTACIAEAGKSVREWQGPSRRGESHSLADRIKGVIRQIFSKYKEIYAQIQCWYHENAPLWLKHAVSLARQLGGKIGELIGRVVKAVKSILARTRQAVQVVLEEGSKFSQFCSKLKILGVLAIGGTIGSFVSQGKEIYRAVNTLDADWGVDAGLKIVETCGDLAGVGEMALSGLQEFGGVAASHSLTLAGTVLSGVGAVLSLATVAFNVKLCAQSIQFQKKLQTLSVDSEEGVFRPFGDKIPVGSQTLDAEGREGGIAPAISVEQSCVEQSLSNGQTLPEKVGKAQESGAFVTRLVRFVDQQSERVLRNRLGIKSGRALKSRMAAIHEKCIHSNEAQAKEIEKEVKSAFYRRLWTAQLSYGLKALASVISAIASGILLFTPLAPLGLGLLAVSSMLGVGLMIADYCLRQHFDRSLERILWGEKSRSEWARDTAKIRAWKPTREILAS